MASMYYKIESGFTWYKSDDGDGIKYNIGDPIPKGITSNKKLIESLLKTRKLGLYDSETNKRLRTKYDFLDLPDEDINYIANTFGWQAVIDRVSFGNFSLDTLKKLRTAVSISETMQNKESVLQIIDNKIKGIDGLFVKETADDEKKNTNNK